MFDGHSFILIRQRAAMVGRALAEVCTVPVLLVMSVATIAHEFEVRLYSKPENLVAVLGAFNAKIFRCFSAKRLQFITVDEKRCIKISTVLPSTTRKRMEGRHRA